MVYKGEITYCVSPNHPDFKCMNDWYKGKIYTYEDEFHFTDDYTEEQCVDYIIQELKLVAGGGYDDRGIYAERICINGRWV